MCFVWIWEQTAIISLYRINWLVCITETECVYCAVRTGFLNINQVTCFVWISEQTAIISLYSIDWLVCVTETESVYCAVRTGCLYIIQVMCFVWISEQTAIISLYSIDWLVCVTETESVYCAVRTGCLSIIKFKLILSSVNKPCLPQAHSELPSALFNWNSQIKLLRVYLCHLARATCLVHFTFPFIALTMFGGG